MAVSHPSAYAGWRGDARDEVLAKARAVELERAEQHHAERALLRLARTRLRISKQRAQRGQAPMGARRLAPS